MRLAASRIIIALAVVAIAAPLTSAWARPDTAGPPTLQAPPASQQSALYRAEAQERRAQLYHPPSHGGISPAGFDLYASAAHPVVDNAPTTGTSGDGFDFGAAAIGAGVAAAVVLLVSGSIVVVRRRGQLQHS